MPKFLDEVEWEWRREEERQEELDSLRERVADLEAQAAEVTVREGSTPHIIRLPYCPRCNEVSERADILEVGPMTYAYHCSACKGPLLVYEQTSRIIDEPYAL